MDGNVELTQRFIRNVRSLAKGKLGKLERDCGVATGFLGRAETGQTKGISLLTASRMAKALEVSLDDLISKDIWRERRIAEISKEINELSAQRDELL